jgi:hypothetical protein
MVRHKRLMLRLYLILVIAVALFGGWYSTHHWQVETETITALKMEDDADWVEFFAGIGEGTIQLFLGFTSE